MLKNYLTTALRNLWRSKGTTFINVSGLTLGVTTSLILFLLVRHESSFDTFHTKRDRIYRVASSSNGNQGRNYSAGIPAVLPEAFKLDFPEAEEVLVSSYRSGNLVSIPQAQGESKKYQEEKGVVYTQPSFFKIFDRKILAGDVEKGLDEPNEAVISEKLALKYFGKQDAIGEVLNVDNAEYKITAIIEDSPINTDLPFDLLLSYITIKKQKDEQGWNSTWSDDNCYFLLRKGSAISEIERRIPAFVEKYLGKENNNKANYEIQPLSSIHFDDRFGNYNYTTTSREMLMALSVIGIFLIVTACINFINLVTAEAIKRSKEVGIRKTLGSSRAQLIIQFLGESSLVTIVAVVLAIGFAQMGLSFLNPFLDMDISLNLLTDGAVWIFLGLTTFLVALLSGLYPSLVVSGFKPVFAIKNQTNNRQSSGYLLRKGLVVLQFFISQFLIIGTIVLISQMDYYKNKDLGFKKDAILTIPIPENERFGNRDGTSKMKTLREELSVISGVEMASLSSRPPSSGSVSSTDFQIEGREEHFGTQVKLVDGNYLNIYGIELVAGANLLDLDTAQGFIVNEKLAATIGSKNPQELIGKVVRMWGKKLPVVGVVKNFHTMSLHEPIEATIMFNSIRNYATISLKVNPSNYQAVVKQVQKRWEAAYPEHIFSYKFLDEEIKEFYE